MQMIVFSLFFMVLWAVSSSTKNYHLQSSSINDTIKFPELSNCRHYSDSHILIRNCPTTATFYLHPFHQLYEIQFSSSINTELASATGIYNRTTKISTIIIQRNDTIHLFLITQRKHQECSLTIKNFGKTELASLHIILDHLVVRQSGQKYISKSLAQLNQFCSSASSSIANGSLEIEFNELADVVEHMYYYTNLSTVYRASFSRKDAIFFDKTNHFIIINRFGEHPSNGSLTVSEQEFISIDPSIFPKPCWSQLGVTHDSESSFVVIHCRFIQTVYILSLSPLMVVDSYEGPNYGEFAFFHSLSNQNQLMDNFSSTLLCFQYDEYLGVRQYARLANPLRLNISEIVLYKLEGRILNVFVNEDNNNSNLTISLLISKPGESHAIYLKGETVSSGFLLNEHEKFIKLADQNICTQHQELCFSDQASKLIKTFGSDFPQCKWDEIKECSFNKSFVKQGCFDSHLKIICGLNKRTNPFEELCEICKQGPESCYHYNQIFFALIQNSCKIFQGNIFVGSTTKGCIPHTWTIGDENSMHGKRVVFQASNPQGVHCGFNFVLQKSEPTIINLNLATQGQQANTPPQISFVFYKVTADGLRNHTFACNKSCLIFQDDFFEHIEIEVSGFDYLQFDLLQSSRRDWVAIKSQFSCAVCQLNSLPRKKPNTRTLVEYPPPTDDCLLTGNKNLLGYCPQAIDSRFCVEENDLETNTTRIVLNKSFILPICKIHLQINSSRMFLGFQIGDGEYISFADSDKLVEFFPRDERYEFPLVRKRMSNPGLWDITIVYLNNKPYPQFLRDHSNSDLIMRIEYGNKVGNRLIGIVIMVLAMLFAAGIVVNVILFYTRYTMRARGGPSPSSEDQLINPYQIVNKPNSSLFQLVLTDEDIQNLSEAGFAITDVGNPVSTEHLDCVVCLDPLTDKQHQLFLCGRHYIHSDCFQEWLGKVIELGRSDLCPMRCQDILYKRKETGSKASEAKSEESIELISKII